jgi:hypothetical protein
VQLCEPEPIPKLNFATPGVGLPAASTVIATAPGASTEMGTVFPFSAISGAVKSIPPLDAFTPPVMSEIKSGVDAINFKGSNVATRVAPLTASVSRLVKFITIS